MILGPYPDVGLAEARGLAAEAHRMVMAGINPIEVRRAERAKRAISSCGARVNV